MKRVLAGLALTAALSSPAVAAEPGGYVDFDLGGANYTGADFGGPNGNVTFTNGATFQMGGGYRFSPNLAVEGGLVGASSDISGFDPFAGYWTESLRTSAAYAAAVGLIPLSPQFDLFGKVGFASVTVDDIYNGGLWATSSQMNLMYGLGAQVNINGNWGIRLQYQNFGNVDFPAGTILLTRGVSIGVNTFTIGGIYTF